MFTWCLHFGKRLLGGGPSTQVCRVKVRLGQQSIDGAMKHGLCLMLTTCLSNQYWLRIFYTAVYFIFERGSNSSNLLPAWQSHRAPGTRQRIHRFGPFAGPGPVGKPCPPCRRACGPQKPRGRHPCLHPLHVLLYLKRWSTTEYPAQILRLNYATDYGV